MRGDHNVQFTPAGSGDCQEPLGWATFGANWVVLCCGLKRPLRVLVLESLGHTPQQDSVSGNWPGGYLLEATKRSTIGSCLCSVYFLLIKKL